MSLSPTSARARSIHRDIRSLRDMKHRRLFLCYVAALILMLGAGWHLHDYVAATTGSYMTAPLRAEANRALLVIWLAIIATLVPAFVARRLVRRHALGLMMNEADPDAMIKRYMFALALIWLGPLLGIVAGFSGALLYQYCCLSFYILQLTTNFITVAVFLGSALYLYILLRRELKAWSRWGH